MKSRDLLRREMLACCDLIYEQRQARRRRARALVRGRASFAELRGRGDAMRRGIRTCIVQGANAEPGGVRITTRSFVRYARQMNALAIDLRSRLRSGALDCGAADGIEYNRLMAQNRRDLFMATARALRELGR